jgi:hypothetical protein
MRYAFLHSILSVLFILSLALSSGAGPAQAAVWTDQADYKPGSMVTILGDNRDGSSYAPGEIVLVTVSGPAGLLLCSGVVVGSGAWSCLVVWQWFSLRWPYSDTAVGQTSGMVRRGIFRR